MTRTLVETPNSPKTPASLFEVYALPRKNDSHPELFSAIKRMVDLSLAILALVLLAPLLLVIALLIKLDSRGPVFYSQLRIGFNRSTGVRPFKLYKFRSMYTGNDETVHRNHVSRLIQQNISVTPDQSLKLKDDPRITRVGHFLRRISLDELGQLLNVLKGDMSFVGPRPPLPYEVDFYKDWHRKRLYAVPGITGWWQVMGRNQVCFDDMVRMDLYYIDHQSLALDLKIILLTPMAIIRGRGAG